MNTDSPIISDQPFRVSSSVQSTLRLLLQAYELARKAQRPVEAFALGLRCLLNEGSSIADLRCLIGAGHIRCLKTGRQSDREQSKDLPLFTSKTSFLLAESGITLCRVLSTAEAVPVQNPEMPYWDGVRELWFVGRVVKYVDGSAEMQTTLLAAFEEQCWKRHIANPFSWQCETDQHKRLLNATYHLNRGQVVDLLRFHVSGGGKHAWWEDLLHRP